MKYTSAEAAKLLRKLNEEVENLEDQEVRTRQFNAAIGEDIESVRPAYDYMDTQRKLDELQAKIRMVKHSLNCFNSTTEVAGFGMTIDQLLVYIPQLSRRKQKLAMMSSCSQKNGRRCPDWEARLSITGMPITISKLQKLIIKACPTSLQRLKQRWIW